MTAAMHYRGPDGINHWRRGNVALGQCMLRTTPESLEETQPLTNEDESLVLVMDGRVDNWEELRRELLGKGAVLRTRADAELVLRAYEIWGEDCPDHIIGECVFFIYDAFQQRLFAARDVAGARHFYYYAGNGWFAFASEINALLTLPRIEHRLNETRLIDYLIVQFDRDDEVGTFYQNILRLPAGHAMMAIALGPRIWRYWNPGGLAESRYASIEECAEAFLAQLRVTVKCRLRSIGPVGAMLSGGLDSSSIVGLISKEFRAELQHPLKTFSLIRDDQENCPDWLAIREMLKDDWFDPILITSALGLDACRAHIDNAKRVSEPFALSQGLTDSLVFEAAQQSGCRVVMDGMAGDLLFYDLRNSLDSVLRRRKFMQIAPVLSAYRRHEIVNWRRIVASRALRSLMSERVLAIFREVRDSNRRVTQEVGVPGDISDLLLPGVAKRYLAHRREQRRGALVLRKCANEQEIHARRFTSGMLSFAHEFNAQVSLTKGVEPRSPFSDRRIIEFAVQMPVAAKLSRRWYKALLRDSMKGVLPEQVRLRRDVGGHPGWKFYEQFVCLVRQDPANNDRFLRSDCTLGGRIDAESLRKFFLEPHIDVDSCTAYNNFMLFVLLEWLRSRPRIMI